MSKDSHLIWWIQSIDKFFATFRGPKNLRIFEFATAISNSLNDYFAEIMIKNPNFQLMLHEIKQLTMHDFVAIGFNHDKSIKYGNFLCSC